MTKEMLDAYFAGIIDGEGTVTIKRQRMAHCTFGVNYQMTVRVGMVDKIVTEMLHTEFGGSLVHQKGSGTRCDVWVWSITSQKALAFLLRMRPYLQIKAAHADLAIEFQNLLTEHSRAGRAFKMDQAAFDLRTSFKDRITVLNRKPGRRGYNPANSVNPATGNAVGNPEPNWVSIDESTPMCV